MFQVAWGLFGRDDVLTEVGSALSRLSDGIGGCVVLEGEHGSGKSAALRAFLTEARERSLTTAFARAQPFDRMAPMTTLQRVLINNRSLGLNDAELPDLLEGRYDIGRRFDLMQRLQSKLTRCSSNRPLVVAVDDLHEADELTTLVLRVLAQGLRTVPILWLFTCRTPAETGKLHPGAWRFDGRIRRLRLERLSDQEALELCRRLLGAQPCPGIIELVEHARGNPAAIKETVCSLLQEGSVSIENGVATVNLADSRGSVRDRLRALGDQTTRLLHAASVLGRPFTLDEAAELLCCSAFELLESAEQALSSRLLAEQDARLTFPHDVIREQLYASVPTTDRHELHLAAARMLQAADETMPQSTEHLLRCAEDGNSRARGILVEAAERQDPRITADVALRTLRLLPAGVATHTRLMVQATRLLVAVGRCHQAQELGRAVPQDQLSSPERAVLLLALATATRQAGEDDATVGLVDCALGEQTPPGAEADLYALRAHALWMSTGTASLDRVERDGQRAIELGERHDVPAAAVLGAMACCKTALASGRIGEAVALASAAVQQADRAELRLPLPGPRLWLSYAMIAADRFAEADVAIEVGRQEAEASGHLWSLPCWSTAQAVLHFEAGRLEDARTSAQLGIRLAEQVVSREATAEMTVLLGRIAITQGRLQEAEQLLTSVLGDHDGLLVRLGPIVGWQLALLGWLRGDNSSASFHLKRLAELSDADRLRLLSAEPTAGPSVSGLAVALGEPDRARPIQASYDLLVERNPQIATYRAASGRVRGLLLGCREESRSAAELFRTGPRPLATAAALTHAAMACREAGERTECAELLGEAVETYRRSGAGAYADLLTDRLRRVGGQSRRRRDRPGRRAYGWDSLTDAELRVARLVAGGLTNRQVAGRLDVSPHTVDTHLRHAFGKLDVSSRVELTRKVLAHDAEPGTDGTGKGASAEAG